MNSDMETWDTPVWQRAKRRPVILTFREVRAPRERVMTLNGPVWAYPGNDYIMRGPDGEEYPINKRIFEHTYEVVA